MDAIADLADRYSFGEIRVGHEQNLVLPHVAQRDLPALWRALDKIGVATPNIGLVTDIISCPGLDYCSLANTRSIPVAQELTRRFRDLADVVEDVVAAYLELRARPDEIFLETVKRVGVEPFKERVYAAR
jgi:sulfite reductase beta subunit-like hemoprotein